MSFGLPSAFLFLLLALPIVVFYILKVRLRRAPTSTTMFWNQIFDEKPPRSIWETLKHLFSLLAQLAILAVLVLAVADPHLPWQLRAARRVVLVIDNSASMQATDISPSRLGAALAKGQTLVDGLRFGDELAVLLAGEYPQVVSGMSGHAPTLKRAIASVTPSDCPTSILPAVRLGRRLIGTHPHGEIVVLSDGCFTGSDTLLAEGTVSLEVFGGSAGNVGITQFQVRRSLVDPLGYEVLAAVRNASTLAMECRLELELDGATVDVLPLKLAPDETWSRSLEKVSLEGGRLVARLSALTQTQPAAAATPFVDSLQCDNSAFAILPPRRIQNVLLVTPGNLFLQKVLESNRLVSLQVVKDLPARWPDDTIVVLHRLVPRTLPPQDVLVIDPESPCEAWQAGGDLENSIITQQDASSPLMRHLKLDNVLMPKVRKLTFAEPPHILAASVTGEAIYAAFKRPAGHKGLVLTASLDEGDLTFRTAFPILVANALSWYSGATGELQPALATGSVTHLPLPGVTQSAALRLVLKSPSGTRTPVILSRATVNSATAEPSPATALLGPLNHVGLWEVIEPPVRPGSAGEIVRAAVASNLSNPAESDVRPPAAMRDVPSRPATAGQWLTRPLWFYLACLVLALTTLEWLLYQRRLIR